MVNQRLTSHMAICMVRLMTAEDIRDRRQAVGWTQFDLAVASRLSPSTIYRAERGDQLTAANLAAIEHAFSHAADGTASVAGRDQISDGDPTPAKKRAAVTTTGG